MSKHRSLVPVEYFFHSTFLLQVDFPETRFHKILAPRAKFCTFKSLKCRPPSKYGAVTFFQLTRGILSSLFFPPFHRNLRMMASNLERIFTGAKRREHWNTGILARTAFISTIFPARFSQDAPQAWILAFSLSINGS